MAPETEGSEMTVDLEYVREHFCPTDARLVGEGPMLNNGLESAIDLMLEHCPVVQSDQQWFGCPDGGWVINRYEDAMYVIQHPEIFSNRVRKGTGYEPPQIPIDIDPPSLVEYKRFLRPYFTMTAVSGVEETAREVVTELIDQFIETGRCDNLTTALSYPFSTKVQWTWLVGVDDETNYDQVLDWIHTIIHRRFEPVFDEARAAWINWLETSLERRRNGPRRDDLIDGLFHNEFEGRPLDDDEIVRIMEIMIIGGVTATADAIGNMMFRLAKYPELQDQLSADPEMIPRAIEELLRVEGPVTGVPRRCTRDVEIGGRLLKEGDQLLIHNSAANRDPRAFEHPHEVDFGRQRNPHLAFGAGHHRCLGSNFARLNLRVALEEILGRMKNIRLVEEDPPERIAGVGWMVKRLPLQFDPAQRS